ncbi:MAG: DUF262 domain-containing protein [Thermoanaerobaculia bacterium]|nr:DUF262 domain-containing protein [Thermoanaerobaculia bacterium]
MRRGLVRVPKFQRPLKWKSEDVVKLFDSIYRGYPIGSLLFYRRPAPAQRLTVGPVTVDAPEITEAWWVVDGQQRVTALTACLVRPAPIPTRARNQDPFAVYFDAEKQGFESPPATGGIPTAWVPLPHLFDASQLAEWVFGWRHRDEEVLRRSVFEAGKRIREYPIPLYLIETNDEKVATEIFYRTNNSGRSLEWEEVHTALFGLEGSSPSTLGDLDDELAEVGMGRFGKERLLTTLLAMRGKDPTRTLVEHYDQDPAVLSGGVVEALPVLRRVLSFLRQDVGIPHLRLLPKSILVDVLMRFFLVHASPAHGHELCWRAGTGVSSSEPVLSMTEPCGGAGSVPSGRTRNGRCKPYSALCTKTGRGLSISRRSSTPAPTTAGSLCSHSPISTPSTSEQGKR